MDKTDRQLHKRAYKIYCSLKSNLDSDYERALDEKLEKDIWRFRRLEHTVKLLYTSLDRSENLSRIRSKLVTKLYAFDFSDEPKAKIQIEGRRTWISNFVGSIKHLLANGATCKRDVIEMRIEDVELDGIILGDYAVSVDLRDVASDGVASDINCVSIEMLNTENMSNNGNPHPHISPDGHICWGNTKPAIRASLLVGDLVGIFDNVESFLRTYNDSSPYYPLSQWNGRCCEQCGSETENVCESCDNADCCGTCCSLCGSYRCQSCAEDYNYCDCCRTSLCSQCLSRLDSRCFDCGGCGCAKQCLECGIATCNNCDSGWEDDWCLECLEKQRAEEDAEAEESEAEIEA